MHMNLYDIIISHTYDRISNGLQIRLELCLVLICKGLLSHDNKFCTIAKLDIRLLLFRRPNHGSACFCSHSSIINLFSGKSIISSMKNLDQSLSAGINHASFFQNREHIRSLSKYLFTITNDLRKKDFQIFCRLRKFLSLLGNSFCNSQDRSFLWFHNSLICCCSSALTRLDKYINIKFLIIPYFFCKSPEKLRKNYTGISSGAPQ